MKNSKILLGLVLLCDENGVIEKVIRDDFEISDKNTSGKTFSSFFSKELVAKALDFILSVKKNSVVFDYSLTAKGRNDVFPLYFTGFFVDQKVWVIGAVTPSTSLNFINQLQQINNEQANYIRSLVKNNYSLQENQSGNDNRLLDELSHLNNELINLQRELSKKNAELARLNELKNQFLGMAAHDIRNPLGIIMSFADFLEEETQDILSDEHRKFLNIINNTAEFLLKMIEDLLDISKIESGKLNLNLEQTDLIELAEKNVQLNNTLASKKGITIKLSFNKKPVMLLIDKQKIEQVFNNLLTNALKFSYQGSEVEMNIVKNENSVITEVVDNGVGIKANQLEAIFQPFSVASSKGTAGEKSTGLGLTIVKKIVEGHSGKINVESTEGKGSRFYFELPLKMNNEK